MTLFELQYLDYRGSRDEVRVTSFELAIVGPSLTFTLCHYADSTGLSPTKSLPGHMQAYGPNPRNQ